MKEMLEGAKDNENARERKRQIKERAQRKAAREERKVRLGQEDVRARRVALIQKFKPMECRYVCWSCMFVGYDDDGL